MPDHSVITSPTDQTAVARIALKALDAASHQRTGNVGSVFVPDGLAGDEDDTDYSTGIVIGTEAGDFGGIAKQDAEGNLTPLVDTDKIDQQLTQAATTAQNAVDQAANAITAVSAATDVANAANANSTEAKTAAEAAGTKADAAQNTASMVGQASTNLWPNQYFDPVKPTLTPFTPTDGVDPEPETPPVGAAVRVGGHNTRDIFNHSNDPGVRASVTPGHTYRISYTAKTIKDEGITPGGGIWYHESQPYDGIGSMTKGADLGDGWFRYTRDFVCPAGKTSGVAYIQIGNSSTKSQVMDIADLVLTDVTAEVVLTASVDANAKNTATALTNANQALARATHITTGTTAPTENVKTGDVWYPTNTDGNVIGMKMWGGSAWADVQLMAGSILVPGSVGATQIADGTITTPKLNVTEDMAVKLLQAHKIEAGEIDLNTLNGQIVNGLVLQTAPEGDRVSILQGHAVVTEDGQIADLVDHLDGTWTRYTVDNDDLGQILFLHDDEKMASLTYQTLVADTINAPSGTDPNAILKMSAASSKTVEKLKLTEGRDQYISFEDDEEHTSPTMNLASKNGSIQIDASQEAAIRGGNVAITADVSGNANGFGTIGIDESGVSVSTPEEVSVRATDADFQLLQMLTIQASKGISARSSGGQWRFLEDGTFSSSGPVKVGGQPAALQTGTYEFGYGSGYKKQSFGHVPGLSRIGNRVFAQGTALKSSGNCAADDKPFGTIPVGYRPNATSYATVVCAGNITANLQMNASGTINIKGAPTGNTPWVCLDDVSWETGDAFPSVTES